MMLLQQVYHCRLIQNHPDADHSSTPMIRTFLCGGVFHKELYPVGGLPSVKNTIVARTLRPRKNITFSFEFHCVF